MNNYIDVIKLKNYQESVIFRYKILNGIFLTLPFLDIEKIAAQLIIFDKHCKESLANGLNSVQIVESYFKIYKDFKRDNLIEMFFSYLQFIERQVVLFDALENASFLENHEILGVNSVDYLLKKLIRLGNKKIDSLYQNSLKNYKLRLVLTAHPTQFYPKNVLGIIADLGHAIKKNDLNKIKDIFLQMSLTPFKEKIKPSPMDEAKSLIWYLENTMYKEITEIQKKIDCSRVNIELGFWPGGDRDGNPFVNAETTKAVASRLHQAILLLYCNDLHKIRHRLTFNEVYDFILTIITKIDKDAYKDVGEYIKDLTYIKNLLIKEYNNVFLNSIDDLILKAKIFGFYFAKLDVRQNSAIHVDTINILFKISKVEVNYSNLSEEEKIILLKKHSKNTKLINYINNSIKEVFDTGFAIYEINNQYHHYMIERYIISNTNSVSNIFEVLFILSLCKKKLKEKNILEKDYCIEIVPLFETINDLKNASKIMNYIFNDQDYMEHLRKLKNRQTIMLGFSDGTKDGGYLMANVIILETKKELLKLAKDYNVELVFFDGRGGPAARGGGNISDFLLSTSYVSSKETHLTIQGQTISSNFGTSESSSYHIEKLFTPYLNSQLFPNSQNELNDKQEKLLLKFANLTYIEYVNLKEQTLFLDYLKDITPFKYFSKVNVGSRPIARKKSLKKISLSEIRAITFVASFMQMKQNILGFYGFGQATHKLLKESKNNLKLLQNLYKDSLFFRTLVNNAMQNLYVSNFTITGHLKNDKKYGTLWNDLFKEARLAEKMLLLISQRGILLSKDVINQQSIIFREDLIVPLLVIEQYSLHKSRKVSSKDKKIYEKLILKSLATNINAGRNVI